MRQTMRGPRWLSLSTRALAVLALAVALTPLMACAQESVATPPAVRDSSLARIAPGFRASAPLGFALRDTMVDQQLYRTGEGSQQAVLWSAHFESSWALTPAQLERWSAQGIGLLAESVGDLRLAGWERLDARDLGDQRAAYRYRLARPDGQVAGEATIVVFTHGSQVTLTGTATTGASLPVDAAGLARALDASGSRG